MALRSCPSEVILPLKQFCYSWIKFTGNLLVGHSWCCVRTKNSKIVFRSLFLQFPTVWVIPIFIDLQNVYTWLTCNFCIQKQQIKFVWAELLCARRGKSNFCPGSSPLPFARRTGYCNRFVAEGWQRKTRKRQTQDAGFGQYGFVNKVTQIGAEIPLGRGGNWKAGSTAQSWVPSRWCF